MYTFQSWQILYTFVIRVRRNTLLILRDIFFTRKQLYKIFANFERSYLLHFPTFYNQTLGYLENTDNISGKHGQHGHGQHAKSNPNCNPNPNPDYYFT